MRRRTLLALGALWWTAAPASADEVVDASQPVIISNDVTNRATEIVSASDGPRGRLEVAEDDGAESERPAARRARRPKQTMPRNPLEEPGS